VSTDIVERIKVGAPWTNDKGEQVITYTVILVNETGQREVNCYDPQGKDLKEDAPLPEGWEVKTSKAGKPYLAAPRLTSGGGGHRGAGPQTTAWRNTEAGAKYGDERVDRRRALEQAIAMNYPAETPFGHILTVAGELYAWLRESVSAPRLGPEPGTRLDGGAVAARTGESNAGVGADTPSDEGGEQLNSPTHYEAASPSSTTPGDCGCGEPWGPHKTPSRKRICLAGHVEKFDYA
jgi:hypothetical protein